MNTIEHEDRTFLVHDHTTKHDVLEEGDSPNCAACKVMLSATGVIMDTLKHSKLEPGDQIMLISNAMANFVVWHAKPGHVSDATNTVLAMVTHMVGRMLKRTGQLKGELDALASKLGVLASAMIDDDDDKKDLGKASIGFRPSDDWKSKN